MTNRDDIKEEIEIILKEGDLKISNSFKKRIINCIENRSIQEEKLYEVIEKILDNSTITKNGREKEPSKNKIEELIDEYIEENIIENDTNEYNDNSLTEEIYNGTYKENHSTNKINNFKRKTLKKTK